MKGWKVTAEKPSASARPLPKQVSNGCESSNTSNTTGTQYSISPRCSPDGRNSASVDLNSNENSNLPTMGDLDKFLNANGPPSTMIKTERCSPDKSTSELSGLTVSLSEAHSKHRPLHTYRETENWNDEDCDNEKFLESKNLVRVKIESSVAANSALFDVPVSMILQREIEMQAAARANNIGKERWTSSRIFRMWKSQCARQQQTLQSQIQLGDSRKEDHNNSLVVGEIYIQMTPEVSLQNSRSSPNIFCWKPWLTSCIRSYYNTGYLRIPDECTGDDILLALEYFGILTASPDDFVFDSKHAYTRIQAWSRYFTHRVDLAESLLEEFDDAEAEESDPTERAHGPPTKTLTWALIDEKDSLSNEQQKLKFVRRRMEGENCENPSFERLMFKDLRVGNSAGLYDLFCERAETNLPLNKDESKCSNLLEQNRLSREMPSRMRQDFCNHLKRSLPPWSAVGFDMEKVELSCRGKGSEIMVETRPVIRIHLDQRIRLNTLDYEDGNGLITYHCPSRSTWKAKNLPDGNEETPSANTYNFHVAKRLGRESKNFDVATKKILTKIEVNSKLRVSEFDECDDKYCPHTPITFVNMDFGDLRSVTSVLSEPILDIRGAQNETYSALKPVNDKTGTGNRGRSPIRVTAKRIVSKRSELREQQLHSVQTTTSEQSLKLKTPPRTTRNLVTPPPWVLDQSIIGLVDVKHRNDPTAINKEEVSRKKYSGKAIVAHANDTKTLGETDGSEWEDENSDSNSGTRPADLHGSWGHFLASMCEVVIPVASSNVLSSSPTRKFTISSNQSAMSSVASSEEEQHISIECSNRGNTEFMQLKSNSFVDQAKKLGNGLSDQLDELMKIAYNEKDQDSKHTCNGRKSLSPIREEVPDVLSIHTDEDHTLASCLTSSILGQSQIDQVPETFRNFREKNGINGYAIPKNKYSDVETFHKCAVNMPQRRIERRGSRSVRHDTVVARKKLSSREVSNERFGSKNHFTKAEYGKDEGNARCSSLTNEKLSGVNFKTYNKENRFSRRENRFYS